VTVNVSNRAARTSSCPNRLPHPRLLPRSHDTQQEDRPGVNKWIVALAVMLPTFIEVMDTSVVNVSLPTFRGA